MSKPLQAFAQSSLSILFLFGVPGRSGQAATNAATAVPPASTAAAPGLIVREGFRLELVADSDVVDSPAALAFDERGRLLVAELRDWPRRPAGDDVSGRIRLLEDSDNDGVYDTAVVVADGLNRPSGIACSRGGVFVGCDTELWYLRDQDGDDQADLRRQLLTFSPASPEGPLDPLLRSLTVGPDLNIYVSHPAPEAFVRDPNATLTDPIRLTGGGFSFNPLTLALRAESGTRVFGQTFDPAGRRFFCAGNAALATELIDAAADRRNPYLPAVPTSAVLIPASGTGGARACLVYPGRKYENALHGQILLADPAAGTVSTVKISEEGLHPVAVEANGERSSSLVRSTAPGFNPTHLIVGPDDLIYIADASWKGSATSAAADSSVPPAHGRIWKLVPAAGSASPVKVFLPVEGDALLRGLEQSNTWIRTMSARRLVEQRVTEVVPDLHRLLQFGKSLEIQLEVLRVLSALDPGATRDLAWAARQKNPTLRTAATLQLVRRVSGGEDTSAFLRSLQLLSQDPLPEIRLRAASALAASSDPSMASWLADVAVRDEGSDWVRRVLLTVQPGLMVPLWDELVREPAMRVSQEDLAFLEEMAVGIGLWADLGEVSASLATVGELPAPPDQTLPLVVALGQGLRGRSLSLSEADSAGRWVGVAANAQAIVTDAADALLRAHAVDALRACIGPDFVADEYLLLLFAPGLPEEMQIPIIRALGAQGLDRDLEALTQRWHLWGPPQQLATLNVLLESPEGAHALLSAIAENTIPAEALTSVHLNLLRQYPADDVQSRARRLFGDAAPDRDGILQRFVEVVDLDGSAARGRGLFASRCRTCHWDGGEGPGPAPAAMRGASELQLIAGIIDPSRDLSDTYRTTVLRLPNGGLVWGSSGDIKGRVIVLTNADGSHRYLNDAVVSVQQPEWSLMPDNIAAGLTGQDVADLIAFIRQASSP